jgi:DNA-directed RNA polymerase subunit M/transcription elongation factor TFIIS
MWPKACPRCGGDLFLDSDYYGNYVSCIQCGYALERSDRSLLARLWTNRSPELSQATVRVSEKAIRGKVA